jgi:hypothetical protein
MPTMLMVIPGMIAISAARQVMMIGARLAALDVHRELSGSFPER